MDVRPSGLQLLLQGRAVEIPRQEIAEVRRNGDSLWNGVLLGGLFGTGVALSFISHADCQTCSAWEAASVGLVLGGGGAALGGFLDYMRRDTRVLYRDVSREAVPVVRVEPMIKPGGWGLALSWCHAFEQRVNMAACPRTSDFAYAVTLQLRSAPALDLARRWRPALGSIAYAVTLQLRSAPALDLARRGSI